MSFSADRADLRGHGGLGGSHANLVNLHAHYFNALEYQWGVTTNVKRCFVMSYMHGRRVLLICSSRHVTSQVTATL